MTFHELRGVIANHPATFARFILPDGSRIPAHAHLTEVAHVIRNFIDCGGLTGKEEKVVLQTHVGTDTDHRLHSDPLGKILQLGSKVLPHTALEVNVEYDCCVVAQYPISGVRVDGDDLDLILTRGRTQCRERERSKAKAAGACCSTTPACC